MPVVLLSVAVAVVLKKVDCVYAKLLTMMMAWGGVVEGVMEVGVRMRCGGGVVWLCHGCLCVKSLRLSLHRLLQFMWF